MDDGYAMPMIATWPTRKNVQRKYKVGSNKTLRCGGDGQGNAAASANCNAMLVS